LGIRVKRAKEHTDWHFDREEQRRLKLEKLVKVAASCFNQKGFSGTSLKDVARHLGITDAALYYYVKSKEELVNLCYVRAMDLGQQALARAIDEGANPLEQLELFIRYQVAEVCGEDGPVAVMSEIPALNEKHRTYILERARQHTRNVTALISAGIEQGMLSSPNAKASCDALLGALNWIPKWYRPDTEMSANDIADAFVHTFIRGLEARTG